MLMQFITLLVFSELLKRMEEGGLQFTIVLLLLLVVGLGLVIYALIKGDDTGKWRSVISSISLFALVWGFFGHMIGLIEALDSISGIGGNIEVPLLAGSLKVGLLLPLFGIVVFLIIRLGIIVLVLREK